MERRPVAACVACGTLFVPEWVAISMEQALQTLCVACREAARRESDRFTVGVGWGV